MADDKVKVEFGATTDQLQSGMKQAASSVSSGTKQIVDAINTMSSQTASSLMSIQKTMVDKLHVSGMKPAAAGVETESKKVTSSVAKMATESTGAINSLHLATTSIFSSIGNAYTGLAAIFLGYGLGAVAKGFLDVSSSMERTDLMLRGVEGSAAKAKEKLEWLLNFSTKAPFTIDALKDSYVKLKVAGLDPTTGSMKALADGVAFFGGTSQNLTGAAVAIQQMASKGVISMEELRQQLGEHIPGATKIMAREMGMSMKDFIKTVSTGGLDAKVGLAALFRGMEKDFGGSAERMMTGWTGLTAQLGLQWTLFRKDVMDQDIFIGLKAGIKTVTDLMKDWRKQGDMAGWAKDLAGTVVAAFGFIAKAAYYTGLAFGGWTIIWEGVKATFDLLIAGIGEGIAKLTNGLAWLFDSVGSMYEFLGRSGEAFNARAISADLRSFSSDMSNAAALMADERVAEGAANIEAAANRVSGLTKGVEDLTRAWEANKAAMKKAGPDSAAKAGEDKEGSSIADKPKGEKMTLLEGWTAELEKTKIAQNDFFKDSRETDLAFWRDRLALTEEKSKDRIGVLSKIYQIEKSLAVEAVQAELTRLKGIEDDTRRSWKEREEAARSAIFAIMATYGKDSKEYAAALNTQARLARAHEAELKQLALDRLAFQRQMRDISLEIEADRINYLSEMDMIKPAQKIEMTKSLEIKKAKGATEAEEQVKNDPGSSAKEVQQAGQNILKIKANLNRQMIKLDQDAAKESIQKWNTVWNSITAGFGNAVKGMIKGTMTLKQGIISIADSILESFVDMGLKMAMDWAKEHIFMAAITAAFPGVQAAASTAVTGIKGAEATAVVSANAAEAASGAAAAVAPTPFIGPGLAIAAFAATMALVLGAMSMISAEGGADIPGGVNPMAQLHQKEMVLPAPLAERVRNMTAPPPVFAVPSSIGQMATAATGQAQAIKETVQPAAATPQQPQPMAAGSAGTLKIKGVSMKDYVKVSDLAKELKKLNRNFALSPRFA